jgi:hypothetical protein
MVDMKWRIRRKFYFKRSRIQALPLTWMGREMEYLKNEAQVCTLNLIGRKMKYLIK